MLEYKQLTGLLNVLGIKYDPMKVESGVILLGLEVF